jgi:hypothetical protein
MLGLFGHLAHAAGVSGFVFAAAAGEPAGCG